MQRRFYLLAGCGIVMIAALLVVGAVSHGVIRHFVQTAPLWMCVVLGLRRSGWSKSAALPCFAFWLLLMLAIWLFLLGIARIVSGSFSPVEIVMTVIVGLAAGVGIVVLAGIRSGIRAWAATAVG